MAPGLQDPGQAMHRAVQGGSLRHGVGGPTHWAGALVTNPAEAQACRLGEAGALGAELAWHSGCPNPLHTSSNLSQRVGVLGEGKSWTESRKACLGGGCPLHPPGAVSCSSEGGDSNLKSSGKDRQHWAASLSSKRTFMSVSEFGLYSW